jgi:hypothetical protein
LKLICGALLQSQIARYAKNPAAQILPRFPLAQMLKQQQKRFLNNFFTVMRGQTQSQQIAQKPVAQLLE